MNSAFNGLLVTVEEKEQQQQQKILPCVYRLSDTHTHTVRKQQSMCLLLFCAPFIKSARSVCAETLRLESHKLVPVNSVTRVSERIGSLLKFCAPLKSTPVCAETSHPES